MTTQVVLCFGYGVYVNRHHVSLISGCACRISFIIPTMLGWLTLKLKILYTHSWCSYSNTLDQSFCMNMLNYWTLYLKIQTHSVSTFSFFSIASKSCIQWLMRHHCRKPLLYVGWCASVACLSLSVFQDSYWWMGEYILTQYKKWHLHNG